MDTIAFLIFCLAIAGVIVEAVIAERTGKPGGGGMFLAAREGQDGAG